MIGTLVSALFLFAIASVNLVILRSTWRIFVRGRRGQRSSEEDLDPLRNNRGFLARLFRPHLA